MLKHLLHCLTALEPAPLSDQDCRNVTRMADYQAKRERFEAMDHDMRAIIWRELIHLDVATIEQACEVGARALSAHASDRDPVELAVQAAILWAGQGGSAA